MRLIVSLILAAVFFMRLAGEITAQESLQKAEELLKARKYAEAVQEYRAALKETPENHALLFQMGLALSLSGQLEEAVASYREALKLNPKMWEAQFNLGMLFYRQDRMEEALPCFQASREIDPQSYQSAFFAARSLERMGKVEDAELLYQQTAGLAKSDVEKAELQLLLAHLYLSRKDFARAETSLEQAREHKAEQDRLNPLLARLYTESGQPEKGVALLERLAAGRPEDATLQALLGKLYRDLKRYPEAARALQAAIRLEKDPARKRDTAFEAVTAFEKAGQIDLAIEFLLPLAATSTDFRAPLQLGSLYLHQKNYPEAEKQCLIALKLNRNCAECWSNLGSAFLMEEKYPLAIQALTEFSRLNSQLAGTYFYLGISYDKLNDAQNAIVNYQKFLELDQGKTEKQDFQTRQRIKALEKRKKKR
jgi:superkiller protein 3